MLAAEEFARPADTGLDFVADNENVVLVAVADHLLDVVFVQGVDAAFALNELHHDGAGGFVDRRQKVVKIVGNGVGKPFSEGIKVVVENLLAGGRPTSSPSGRGRNLKA